MCPTSVISVNMLGKGKVAMRDFELLKVLGTGGELEFSLSIHLAFIIAMSLC